MRFKVIQSHQFRRQWKARMRLPVTYLISCTVSKIWLIICQIFAVEGVSVFNALAGGELLNLGLRNLASRN